MSGAPDVITNPYYMGSQSNPIQDAQSAVRRSARVIQTIPVYGRPYDYSVPAVMYNRGWIAPDVPTVAGPTYHQAVEAPSVIYTNKAYQGLVSMAASPPKTINRSSYNVGAPSIDTSY